MEKINFTKMNGAGNDFILIDTEENKEVLLTSCLIQQLCDRRKGIGADGILLIKSSTSHDYELEYYNSDGSLGSLCGNGSRCSIKYYFEKNNDIKTKISFLCSGITYSGKIEGNGLITFFLDDPIDLKLNIEIKINEQEFPIHYVNTGSPHAVIFWDYLKKNFNEDFNAFDAKTLGKNIRYSEEFQPKGTNVNFVYKDTKGNLNIRTYERGVEDETYACGTGTVASALVSSLIYSLNPPLNFTTFGKDKLVVNFQKKNDLFSKITLTGPVKINYIGTYNFIK